MAENKEVIITINGGRDEAVFCREYHVRSLADLEKTKKNLPALVEAEYADNPRVTPADKKVMLDYDKKLADKVEEKFKNGEYPLKEWEQKEEKQEEDSHPKPNIALPQKPRDDSPTGEGNTLGSIVGQAGVSQNAPHEANPSVAVEAEPEQTAWETTKKIGKAIGNMAADKAKQTGQDLSTLEGWNPIEQQKGFAKAASNAVVDTAEGYIKGAKLETSHDLEQQARLLEFFGGEKYTKNVEIMRDAAKENRKNTQEFNLDNLKMSMDTPGQRLGELGFEIVSLFDLPASKASKSAKAIDEISTLEKVIQAENRVIKNKTGINNTTGTQGKTSNLETPNTSEVSNPPGATIQGKKKTDNSDTSPTSNAKNSEQDGVNNQSNNKEGSCTGTCKTEGEPVDMATGDFLQVWPVIAIPGLLPITLTRTYRSTAKYSGLFGPKWADDWSRQLMLTTGKVNFSDADGVIYDYNTPENQVLARNQHIPHYILTGELTGELQLTDRQSQLTYHFNHAIGSIRKLSAITDRRQNAIQFIYDKQSQLIEVTRTDGFRLILGYQDQQLQTLDYLEQKKQQRLVTCHYDPQGYLSECEAFQHNHLWHEYDAQGRMIRWHDTDQTDVTLTYDDRGRVLTTSTTSGYWNDRFLYDDNARITTYIDAEGGETQHHYDNNCLVIREVDPLGRITRRQWRNSQIVWEADPSGAITTFDYNPDGALTEVKLPTGDTFYYGYDEHGQLTESILPTGDRWQFHYDEQGNLTALTNPLGNKEEYQYGLHGELRQRLLPDGRQWHYAYDEQQRLAAVMTPDGQTTGLQLDELGRLRQLTDALKQQTHYRYSDDHASLNGSLTEVELPDGTTQQLTYDSERRVVAVTDGEGRTTRYTYGAFDLLNQVARPDGTVLRFGYDRLTRLNSVTASTGETYRYERDAAGQIIRETDFTGRTIDYQYDKLGRRLQSQYPDGQQLRWYYSAAGSLIKQESWQPEDGRLVLKATTTYEYNKRYQLVKATNADATVEYEYDKTTGLPICERINGREIVREWDSLTGRPISESVDGNTLHFSYDLSGSLNHFQLNQHAPLTFQHDALGRETVRESANGFILASRYTATGLLAHQSAGQATQFFRETLAQNDPHFPPQATAVNRSWQYDRAHNVRVIDDSRWGQTRYRYNTNDQILHTLFEGARPHEEQFSYDANGNLNQHIPTDARGAVAQINQRQKAGRVVQQGDIRYHYDDNGRLIEKTEQRDGFRPQVWRYRWDTQNQLTHCETPDGSRWQYKYDPFGRRLQKLKIHDGKLAATNLQLWLAGKPDVVPRTDAIIGQAYLWSGDQLIEETPIYADGTPAENQRVRWLYEPGTLTPSARFEKGKLHYIISDHQGTPREILNEEGQLIWAQRLRTWGQVDRFQVIASNNPDYHVNCNLRFQGQYEDEESGLYYNRFRYYSPETGQYLSPDPIGLMGGFNPYSYVHNPSKWVDPYGLAGADGNKGDYLITYRGDTRSFTEIFDKGFETRGPSNDLYLHALDNKNPPSNFISTTTDPSKTIGFATNYGSQSGYVYTMKTNNGIDVNKVLGSKSPYPGEAEIAIPGGVKSENILGARPINADGEMWDYTILNPKRYGK